jgi:uncharacterized membrane protein YdfJ with MMPL/SSD domain
MLGPSLAAAWFIAHVRRGRRAAWLVPTICVAVLLALGIWSFIQTSHWRDTNALLDQAFWVHPVGAAPGRRPQ